MLADIARIEPSPAPPIGTTGYDHHHDQWLRLFYNDSRDNGDKISTIRLEAAPALAHDVQKTIHFTQDLGSDMSTMTGLKMAVAAAVVGGGLYATLEMLRPYHHPEVKMEGLVPEETVFASTTDAAAAAPAEAAAANVGAASAAPEPAAAEAPAPKPAPEAAPVSTPAPVASKAAAPAEKAVEKKAPATPAAAVTAPAPAAKPAAVAAAPKPAATAEKSAAKSPAVSPVAWWQGSGSANGLSVSYVGSAAFKRALVVMTNGSFDNPAAANRSIKVLGAGGKAVAGSWEINSGNPGMLVFPVASNGIYQLVIGADLSDRQNRQLGRVAQGPVEVR